MAKTNNLLLFLSVLWDNGAQWVFSLGASQAVLIRWQLGLESNEDITGPIIWNVSSLTSLAPLQGWLGLRGAGCPSLSLSPPSLPMWVAWAFSQHHALKTVGFLTWQLASTCVRNPRNPRKSWKVSILLNLEGHVASLLHILLVKSKSQGPPRFTGRGIHRV